MQENQAHLAGLEIMPLQKAAKVNPLVRAGVFLCTKSRKTPNGRRGHPQDSSEDSSSEDDGHSEDDALAPAHPPLE